jgi:hypothetical protein
MSTVSDYYPQKLAYKNTKAKEIFGSASNGKNFRVPVSNPDGKDRLQKTKQN